MVDIHVLNADITKIDADFIVNAANPRLLGGGGVDGAIHLAGGGQIMIECDRIRSQQGGCPTGEAVITTAGRLPARFVIHTVGPIWNDDNNMETEKLKMCYQNCLNLACRQYEKEQLHKNFQGLSISFPNISTGIYGFPKDKAAVIATDTVRRFLDTTPSLIKRVNFVCFDDENHTIYKQLIGGKHA